MTAATPHPDRPESYPRRILLGVIGLTPQIVTETLYGLIVDRQPPFLPTEIHLITTAAGRDRLAFALLDPQSGQLGAFCRDFACPELLDALDLERVHVIAAADGTPLADIETPEDNRAAADAMTAQVRRLTGDPAAALHVSMAGGRKTMGFLLGYALSLFGRAQDRLSHVLVAPVAFESHPQFFYPPPRSRQLLTRDGAPLDTTEARIRLADMPFVRLRHGLPQAMLAGAAACSGTVAELQASFRPPAMRLAYPAGELRCHGRPIDLPPHLFAWLLWLALRRRDPARSDVPIQWETAEPAEFLDLYRELPGTERPIERFRKALRHGFSRGYCEEKNSRINRRLQAALGAAAEPYLIRTFGRRPKTAFRLTLPPEAIEIDQQRARHRRQTPPTTLVAAERSRDNMAISSDLPERDTTGR